MDEGSPFAEIAGPSFEISTPIVSFAYRDIVVGTDGGWREGDELPFEIRAERQMVRLAGVEAPRVRGDSEPIAKHGLQREGVDLETGPARLQGPTPFQDGFLCGAGIGPYAAVPLVFAGVEAWERAAPRDGFVLHEQPEGGWILGRIGGQVFRLSYANQSQQYLFDDGVAEVRMSGWTHVVLGLRRGRTARRALMISS